MGMHQKGLETQIKIVHISKKLFYEKGYEKTTIKEICEIANLKSGNFNYYFKTKDDLLKHIYSELYMKSYSFVESHLTRKVNSIEKNVFTTYPYMQGIFKDPKIMDFHYEIIRTKSIAFYLGYNFNHVYKQFFKDLKLHLSQNQMQNFINAELGMRRELSLYFIENPDKQNIFDLVDAILIFRARLMQMDETLMKSYLYNALEFNRTYDQQHLSLLL